LAMKLIRAEKLIRAANLIRAIILVYLAVSCSILPVAKADGHRQDGNWWNRQTGPSKLMYLSGFFDGINMGHRLSVAGLMKSEPAQADTAALTTQSFAKLVDRYLKHVTSGQISDGLDEFYKDYRNRTILVEDGVWVVLVSTAGMPQPEVNKIIETFRRNREE
jgi:hypothetical protein